MSIAGLTGFLSIPLFTFVMNNLQGFFNPNSNLSTVFLAHSQRWTSFLLLALFWSAFSLGSQNILSLI